MACCPRGGNSGWVTYSASRRVRRDGQGTHGPDPHLASGESPNAVDGVTRSGVPRGLRLEQRQRSLSAISRPHCQHSPVVLAQRQRTRFASHWQDSATGRGV